MISESIPKQGEHAPPQSLKRILLVLCAQAHASHPAPSLTLADWELLTRAFERHSAWTSPRTPIGGIWHVAHGRPEIREAMTTSSNPAIRDLAARYASAEALAAIEAVMTTTPNPISTP
ncbi:MAG: hypothetical protein U1C04_19040 [Hydrogenophaga sp.]|uniref:hypothetical protein n=1 Tax=Hydrogenophaga sp. TaxID=1904254 RepID=UPI002AB9B3F8|nr:hypothetical protein [Hydrogenophaga sp.]MDZ4282846.1 hypothetical protein [Hydrogenophaga sp.]